MCGILAVIQSELSKTPAAADLLEALYLLQHRGQDACGIATCGRGGRIYQCKGNGMASKVFNDGDRVKDLPGFMGVGHLRYPTAGSSANAEAQPFYVNSPYGICMTHNGNLINARELRAYLDRSAHRHINTDSDSELMLNTFADELNETGKARVNADDCFAALQRMYTRCKGGWACTAMIAGFGLIGFRDPHGIRPMVLGKRIDPETGGVDYMMASESVALQYFGCRREDIQDILPGQAVILEKGKAPRFHQVQEPLAYAPDIFEFVYFARPDSVIDGISVYKSRRAMGFSLGETIAKTLGPDVIDEIDIVVPIPETSNTSARCVAEYLNKPLIDGFIKNRYVFRTFIMPTQGLRKKGVRRKLNAQQDEFEGRNVLLVDDSIVRGTTSKEIVQMAREAGANKVYFASCAPPITHAHIYGIDLASASELIASNKGPEDVAKTIGAEAVVYQSLKALEGACASLSPRDPSTQKFEVGVFCGNYITPVDDDYLEHLEMVRGQRKKMKVQETATKNILNGIANEDVIKLAAGDSQFDRHGRIVPIGPTNSTETWEQNSPDAERKSYLSSRESQGIRSQQDISLDNLNDHNA